MTTYTFYTADDGINGTVLTGINDAGQIVGTKYDPNVSTGHGFLYNGVTYTPLDSPSGTAIVPTGINDMGQIVGYYGAIGGQHGFSLYLYNSGGTYITLNDPLSTGDTNAFGINNAGQIVGQNFDSNNVTSHGFLYNGVTYTPLNDPAIGAYDTVAEGINNLGQIVGSYLDNTGASHGFLFSGGTYTTLDDPLAVKNTNSIGTTATGINDKGQIVGYYYDSGGIAESFLYSGGIYTTYEVFGHGTFANSINNAGQIVGGYQDLNGTSHGFLATPSTSPTSVQQETLGLYAALYNRAADFPGYSYWVGIDGQQSDSGGVTVANAGTTAVTLNDAGVLGQAFVNTQNTYFNSLYGSLSDSAFINAMYVNIGGNAGDPGGISYWEGLLAQAEGSNPTAAQIQAARAGLVGQFVHDLIDFDLSPGAAALNLTAAQYQQAQTRQEAINDKIAVSLAYLNASQQPSGSILNAHSVGDAAFNASVTVMQGVTSDFGTVTAGILGINNVIAHQDLTLI